MIIIENKLKNDYVSVTGQKGKTFGGSQSFFKEMPGFMNKFKNKGGCGVVALSDLISYLGSKKQFDSPSEYMKYFNSVAAKILWIPTPLGLTFLHQLAGLKFLFITNRLDYRCFWGFSRKKLFVRINRMLSLDIPVILCIPKLLGPNAAKRGLSYYRLGNNDELKEAGRVHGHFVTVTGILSKDNEKYLEISSWGQRLYLNFEEYLSFTKKTPMSLLGYNMCVSKK